MFQIPALENPGKITWEQIVDLANQLTVEPNVVNAIYLTEASGDGYLPSGKPKILFEGHVFWKHLVKNKLTPSKYLKGNEDILYKLWTKKFYKGGEKEYSRLNRAIEIHENSALCAASWGAFQVLGENYIDLGYPDVQTFVLKMCAGYTGQLEILGQFLKFKKLIPAMKRHDWDTIALKYNGSSYKNNRYDTIMNQNYIKSKGIHPSD
jgi:hypothetical protein